MLGFSIALAGAFYCLPMLIGYGRDHRQADLITTLNLLLGWTLIGWLIAIMMACGNPAGRRYFTVQTDSYKAPQTVAP